MSLVIEREELITKFLLGDLPEQQRAEVELQMLSGGNVLDEILLVEGQLADSLLLGTLPDQQLERVRNVPELQHQVSITKLLTEISRHRSTDTSDDLWEKSLSEVEQNRRLLESLIASHWDGLRTLMLLGRVPHGMKELQARANISQEQLSQVLTRLTTAGAVQENDGVFSVTAMGEKCLRAFESLT